MAYQNDDDNDDAVQNEELTDEDLALLGSSREDDEDEDGDSSDEPAAVESRPAEEVLVTKEGLEKLKNELHDLENVRRRELAERLKEAIGFGDLSENSEYQDAKAEQAFLEGRIVELREMIKNAKVIKSSSASGAIKIGSTVTVQNITDKTDPETFTIVGSTEADPLANKISNESPLGSALLDQGKGDEVQIKAPGGTFKYKVVKVA